MSANITSWKKGRKNWEKVAYPITETDSKLEKLLSKEYECPVCLNFASPPIMMCVNSHIICFDCWKRCTNCPTCRAAKTLTRAFILEKIHSLITFPCRWEGCSFLSNASYTGVHEYLCAYYPLRCPLGDTHQCGWIGNMKTVQEHLSQAHEDNVFYNSEVVLRSRCFSKSVKKDYTLIFVVNDRLFKFYWSFDTSISSKVRFGMVSIGNGNPIVIYSYSLILAKQFPINHNCRKFKLMKAQVKKSFSDCSLVDKVPGAPTTRIINHEQDYADLVSFCNYSDLIYQVIIEVSHLTKFNELGNNLV